MKKTYFIFAILVVGGLITAGFLVFQNGDTDNQNGGDKKQEATVFYFDENESVIDEAELGENYNTFVHPKRGFSLEYLDEFEITGFEEEEGETVVFQRPGDEDRPLSEKEGFQLYIIPYEVGEKNPVLTPDEILEDVSFVVIEKPQEAIVGDDIRALIFWSVDGLGRPTREAWLVYDGYLYEFTTFAHLDSFLAKILSTLRFQ